MTSTTEATTIEVKRLINYCKDRRTKNQKMLKVHRQRMLKTKDSEEEIIHFASACGTIGRIEALSRIIRYLEFIS